MIVKVPVAEALEDFDVSKGTIILPYKKELPQELIIQIANGCCIK